MQTTIAILVVINYISIGILTLACTPVFEPEQHIYAFLRTNIKWYSSLVKLYNVLRILAFPLVLFCIMFDYLSRDHGEALKRDIAHQEMNKAMYEIIQKKTNEENS